MGKKDEDDDDEFDLAELFDTHFTDVKKKGTINETPLERYRRTGIKLPPPNNPHTKEGRAWITANCKKIDPSLPIKKRVSKKKTLSSKSDSEL